jgi:hypothetical protein
VTDSESGNQTIEYGNFFNNTVLAAILGRLATIAVTFNGLFLSHCWFSENDADIAALNVAELGHLFSLSYCFFSGPYPTRTLFTIETECSDNILTGSWAMEAPTQDIGVCVPPCTIETATREFLTIEITDIAFQSPSSASSQSDTLSDPLDQTVSPSPVEFLSESPSDVPSDSPSDDPIRSLSHSLPDGLSPSVEDLLSQSPTELPSDSPAQSLSDPLPVPLVESPTESLADATTAVAVDHPQSETDLRFISLSVSSFGTVTHSVSDSTDSGKVVNPPITSHSEDSGGEGGLRIGVIIGIIAGVIVLIAVVVVAVFFGLHGRTQTSQHTGNEMKAGTFSDLDMNHLATFANALSDGSGDLWQDNADEGV